MARARGKKAQNIPIAKRRLRRRWFCRFGMERSCPNDKRSENAGLGSLLPGKLMMDNCSFTLRVWNNRGMTRREEAVMTTGHFYTPETTGQTLRQLHKRASQRHVRGH